MKKLSILSLILLFSTIGLQADWFNGRASGISGETVSLSSRGEKQKEDTQVQSKKFKYKSPRSATYSAPFTQTQSKSKTLGKNLSKIRSDNKSIINSSMGRTHAFTYESHALKKAPRGLASLPGILFVYPEVFELYLKNLNKLFYAKYPYSEMSLYSKKGAINRKYADPYGIGTKTYEDDISLLTKEENKKYQQDTKNWWNKYFKITSEGSWKITSSIAKDFTKRANKLGYKVRAIYPDRDIVYYPINDFTQYDNPYFTGCGDKNDDTVKEIIEKMDIPSYYKDIIEEFDLDDTHSPKSHKIFKK